MWRKLCFLLAFVHLDTASASSFGVSVGAGTFSSQPDISYRPTSKGQVFFGLLNAQSELKALELSVGLGLHQTRIDGDSTSQSEEVLHTAGRLDLRAAYPVLGDYLQLGIGSSSRMGAGAELDIDASDSFQTAHFVGPVVGFRYPYGDSYITADIAYYQDMSVSFAKQSSFQFSIGYAIDSFGKKAPVEEAAPTPEARPEPELAQVQPAQSQEEKVESLHVFGSEQLVYKLNAYELGRSSKDFATKLAQFLKSNQKSWKKIRIEGFAESMEGAELAQRRAESIKELLLAQGISADLMEALSSPEKPEGNRQISQVRVFGTSNAAAEFSKAAADFEAALKDEFVKINHKNLTFVRGKSKPGPLASSALNQVAAILNKNAKAWTHIVVYGHSHAAGTPELIVKVANERAQNVATFLQQIGIVADRQEGLGVASERSFDPNDRDSPVNRRIEIDVYGISDATLRKELAALNNIQ